MSLSFEDINGLCHPEEGHSTDVGLRNTKKKKEEMMSIEVKERVVCAVTGGNIRESRET